MDTHSVEGLLEWLKVKPRTLGWGSILAYGRSQTNKVLLQEYIRRFSEKDGYLKPVTEEIADNTTETQKEFIKDYQLDTPRLSFLGSNLQKSSAHLLMRVVGGSHLTFNRAVGGAQWNVTRIAEDDILDGPSLTCTVDLMATSGTTISAGKVVLDISNGVGYELDYVQTPHLRRVAGARFQTIFKGLPEDLKQFPLSELKFKEGQVLKPSKFHIRTHNKKESGASLLANEDEGEGAVLVFVAMDGDANGTLPADNGDLKYLLPDGYSATVLLKQDIMQNVIVEGMKRANELPGEFKYEDIVENGNIYGVRAVNGGVKISATKSTVNSTSLETHSADLLFDSINNKFEFWSPHYHEDSFFDYRFMLSGFQKLPATVMGPSGGKHGTLNVNFSFYHELKLAIEDGQLVFKLHQVRNELVFISTNDFEGFPDINQLKDSATALLKSEIGGVLRAATDRFVKALPVINAYTLNSLLFRGDNTVTLERVDQPLDLAVFGQVGPMLNAFTIDQLEPIVGHSEQLTFTTTPVRTDLTWKVENILGQTGPVGKFTNPRTGLYSAPTSTELQGSFVRARVTATADSGHTSSALVTVMRRGISVNPRIQVVPMHVSVEPRDVSAGTIDGGTLTWSMGPDAVGEVEPKPVGGGYQYVQGPAIPKSPPTIDTIVVTNPRTKLSETAHVLALHRDALLTVLIDDKAGLPDNQLQLFLMGEDEDENPMPIPPDAWKQRWSVLHGGSSAQINEITGVLTVNPVGPDSFVVVTVLVPSLFPGMPIQDGYIILPLPLFSVPDTIRLLSADGQ